MTGRARRIVGPDYLVAGRYRLQAKLGGGGMGAVWLAHDTLLDRDVAIKQITSTADLDTEEAEHLRTRTIREGRNAAKLSHQHAIGMYDVALDGGEPWLVMEYLPSRSLAQALNIVDTLPPLEVAQIGAQVADALADAHAAGIVHRDIKPGNILIADRGNHVGMVKISDFGISRTKGDSDGERSGVITGTPAYFSPEVARGDNPTEASDVFSLGATLYTATEGEPPFGIDQDSIELLNRVAQAKIKPPRRSEPITDALLHMLEPDPSRRPTMAEVRDTLAGIAVGKGRNAAYILGAPVRSADGEVPDWALRSAYGKRRASRLPGATVDGLPAAPKGAPLPSISHPPRMFDAAGSSQPRAVNPTQPAANPTQPRAATIPAAETIHPFAPPRKIEPNAKTDEATEESGLMPLMIALALLLGVVVAIAAIVFIITSI